MDETVKHFKRVDILVNNASYQVRSEPEKSQDADMCAAQARQHQREAETAWAGRKGVWQLAAFGLWWFRACVCMCGTRRLCRGVPASAGRGAFWAESAQTGVSQDEGVLVSRAPGRSACVQSRLALTGARA